MRKYMYIEWRGVQIIVYNNNTQHVAAAHDLRPANAIAEYESCLNFEVGTGTI